jgi:hypothetical protein
MITYYLEVHKIDKKDLAEIIEKLKLAGWLLVAPLESNKYFCFNSKKRMFGFFYRPVTGDLTPIYQKSRYEFMNITLKSIIK